MNVKHPPSPKYAKRFLMLFLKGRLAEEVIGDLDEDYYLTLKNHSRLRARLNYWYQVLSYVRPFAVRKPKFSKTNYSIMYINYFKSAFRSLLKKKLHSVINITGLSAGITVSILIGLWIESELSFNKVHNNYDRIARVIQNVTNNDEVQTWFNVPYPLADVLRKNYKEDFNKVVMGTSSWDHVLSVGEKAFIKNGIFFEPGAPDLLSLKMLEGTRAGFNDPASIFISRSLSLALFGSDSPMGKAIKIDDQMDVHVTGVYEDIPRNSSFNDLSFIAPWKLFEDNTTWIQSISDPWRPNAFQLFVQLAEHTRLDEVSHKIKDEKLRHINEALAKKKPELLLFPMSSWHLFSEFKNGINTGGRITYVRFFGLIGAFVLFLACINFINLSTARSEKRAKEVGIRKAIGSLKGQLIQQFLVESFLITLIAFATALILLQLSLPFFNRIAGVEMNIPLSNSLFWLIGLGFCFIVALCAGLYPAVYLSSFQPVKALRGNSFSGKQTRIYRRILVVIQFSVSISLIAGTVVVFRQIETARNRDLGYNLNQLISVPMYSNNIHKHFDAIREELLNSDAISEMSESVSLPTFQGPSSSGFTWEGKDPNLSIDFPFVNVSWDYGKTVKWQIVKGRDFSRDFLSDSSAMILNEAAIKFMDLQDPIGATIKWFDQPFHVIGVTKDMVMNSPYEPVTPTVFTLASSAQNYLLVRLKGISATQKELSEIQNVISKYDPSVPFDYQFADKEFAKKFNTEERIGSLAGAFTTLAIIISCLGIFGLASFITEQRTKEIGIRKVHGASIFTIWKQLSREFVNLVCISFVISTPIVYEVLYQWLQHYQYRTSLRWWIFLTAGTMTLIITLLTVSYHTLSAARAKPVNSLKRE